MKYNVIDVDASALQEKYKIGLLSAKLLKASHLDDEEIHESVMFTEATEEVAEDKAESLIKKIWNGYCTYNQ